MGRADQSNHILVAESVELVLDNAATRLPTNYKRNDGSFFHTDLNARVAVPDAQTDDWKPVSYIGSKDEMISLNHFINSFDCHQ
jgi:hypothetical protein